MPKKANIEDAPHFLNLLKEYANTSITLSLGLLGLSVTFGDSLLKPPIDIWQVTMLAGNWIFLFAALVCGLMINAQLIGVSANYMKALGIAYPDMLSAIAEGSGQPVRIDDPHEEIKVDNAAMRDEMKAALTKSHLRMQKAGAIASVSFWQFAFASLFIIGLGLYGAIAKGGPIDAAGAVRSARTFVADNYNVALTGVSFRTLTFEESQGIYTIEFVTTQTPPVTYVVKVNKQDIVQKVSTSP